ncbi:hypothetical protein SS1G_06597 [Sclerotinia sclerotiorum 1980 UF-70]|uniref:DNA replication regulator Sld3 C-terminal domain-containing protein n=1 Tax=Sclerotinia sclerotiorum (strain ATCC 18683 / 1980 / Ss-1) TaxID=665079 RepID=A7EMP8_SCLS1|nr:hypothetical protein SS1G_06597 [Sclerotinia sclerotiorum 1980 UF-70]EDO04114.1 hypothetical protein SS1G_06597 [Sclerotinia sclerotiorum 1980 UF-70]
MSSQDAFPFSDASIHQARRQSAVLTPSSQSIGQDDRGSLGSKKRKRDGNSLEDLLKDTFIVKILELEERMGNQPMVLIARLDDNRTLYAVERESRGLYVILQLGSWINIHQLKSSAVVAQTERADVPVKGMLLGSAHLGASAESFITPEGSKYNKKKRLAIEAIQSMIKRPSTPLLPEPRPQSAAPESLPVPEAENVFQATVSLPALETKTQATAPEIFDNIRNQYFESLYLSKTSLAYFAKGPLSRARAAFHLDFDANLDMNDHIAFLESLVLSSTLLDKKYRDGVPTCVSAIDIQDQSADDATVKPQKRKGNKKMKPGKNGLYPNEESLIGKWWVGHDEEIESGAPGSSKDEMAKTRIANLRIRETQLQMIVILEILALQPLASTTENVEGGLPSLPSYDIIQSKERTPKTRKQDHLTMLIDVHIDRLCIWQSIATEAIKAPETSSDPTAAKTVNHTDNILKDFCIEVIAPFFSARLPDRCDTINRKLGGPITKSASKPRIPKSASFSNTPTRPGAVTKRPVPAKQRKSLQRVLTDDRERRTKKQAAIDAELKDAISAVKKPNRFQPVQIKATPKNNRRKDVFGESQSTLGGSEQMEVGLVPPSSVPTIPQSKVRLAYDQDPFRDSIQATPSRKSSSTASMPMDNFKNYDAGYAIPPSSPLQMRRSSAQLFNSIPDSVVKRPVSAVPRGILETPIKRSSSSTLYNGIEETPMKETPLRETPVKETPLGKISEWKLGQKNEFGPSNQDQENLRDVPVALEKMKPTQIYKKEISYYEALGWNDDDIDDLA